MSEVHARDGDDSSELKMSSPGSSEGSEIMKNLENHDFRVEKNENLKFSKLLPASIPGVPERPTRQEVRVSRVFAFVLVNFTIGRGARTLCEENHGNFGNHDFRCKNSLSDELSHLSMPPKTDQSNAARDVEEIANTLKTIV